MSVPVVKVIAYPMDMKHRDRRWCSCVVAPYGMSPRHKHITRPCRRKAHYVVDGADYCELHAGQCCVNLLATGPDA